MGNKHSKSKTGEHREANPISEGLHHLAEGVTGSSFSNDDKLYYSPAALSGAAVFIAAFIGEINMPCETIDVVAKTSVTGVALRDLNVLENVPFMILADGVVLSEQQVIIDYLLERAPRELGAHHKNAQYFYMKQVIGYIHTNLIPSLDLLSRASDESDTMMQESNINFFRAIAERALTVLDEFYLDRKQFLVGEKLSVADVVLYTTLNAANTIGKVSNLGRWPNLKAYFDRLDKQEKIQEAQTRMLSNPQHVVHSHQQKGVF